MATVQETKRSDVELDKDALFERTKALLNEHSRAEASRLNDIITPRQAFLKSMKPDERARLFEHMKAPLIPAAPVIRPDRQIPLPTCISYQVFRPPFTDWYQLEPTVRGYFCVNSITHERLDLSAVSEQSIGSEGTLSVQAAIGEFINARCQSSQSDLSWPIGENNSAYASIGVIKDTGVVPPGPGFITVEVDLVLDGQPDGWTYFRFPGEPSSGLGLVGSIGIANMYFQVRDIPGDTETYERFLLGSASAYFPGALDVKPTFTLSRSAFLPVNGTSIVYSIYLGVELTVFRSIPVQGGGYPGYVQANLTVPGTPRMLGPGTPLRVKEVRTSICLL